MMKSALIRSCPSLLRVEATNARVSSSSKGAVSCSTRINSRDNIPKLEPFSRSKVERALKEPPLIQKCENELSDYCSTLEGDASYSCWSAYFELRELEKEVPKEEVERLIVAAGGVKSLIGFLHGVAEIHRVKKNGSVATNPTDTEKGLERLCPIPDGLPKTREEIEEEERSRMPDSPFTRLLRTKGTYPAWYSPAPDHETS